MVLVDPRGRGFVFDWVLKQNGRVNLGKGASPGGSPRVSESGRSTPVAGPFFACRPPFSPPTAYIKVYFFLCCASWLPVADSQCWLPTISRATGSKSLGILTPYQAQTQHNLGLAIFGGDVLGEVSIELFGSAKKCLAHLSLPPPPVRRRFSCGLASPQSVYLGPKNPPVLIFHHSYSYT